jgi:NAD(P)H-flavin reductase
MKVTEAIIERLRAVNSTHQHLHLAVDESLMAIKPGQFLLARVGDRWDPYLRVTWYPVDVQDNKLVVERPLDEKYDLGQTVSIVGVAGDHFRFRKGVRNILLIAYDCAPTPMLMILPWLLRNNIAATLVLLGEATKYETQHLPPEIEVIEGDSELNWPDQVMSVGWADQIFVCVAQDDESYRFARVLARIKERRSEVPKNYLFGIYQGFGCGIGMCDVCAVRTEDGVKLACMKGPSFDLTLVKLDSVINRDAPQEAGSSDGA